MRWYQQLENHDTWLGMTSTTPPPSTSVSWRINAASAVWDRASHVLSRQLGMPATSVPTPSIPATLWSLSMGAFILYPTLLESKLPTTILHLLVHPTCILLLPILRNLVNVRVIAQALHQQSSNLGKKVSCVSISSCATEGLNSF